MVHPSPEHARIENEQEREKDVLWLFDLALILKIINGVFEMLAAFVILVIPSSLVLRIAEYVTSGEIAEDPNDFFATNIRAAAHTFAVHTHYFVALYLVLHGAVKVVLVSGIFQKRRNAYTLFMIALALFGSYELFLGEIRAELLLDVLATLDFCLLLLTAHEYRRRYSATARN
ncbi:MAG: DUF2127 domain-containing protein [Minisyncoccia bacterium]